ncbi:anti-sigma factor antagonist [Bacillus sonorensis]|uniref:Anti-sigma factor antagonist n=2 Tax=Bacillus sonorensis TaxID=119858 RepID=M5P3R3_9BACI|nr:MULTISPECIES: anti-sigma factor antagonist [Bacillus]TWK75227.1 Anti-sigma-B factor antagonist [Bacillus paralicheniformis]ASB90940.1 Anti-sigma-B factor antagonist [Bacillus sonorensis]EME74088.1 anti-sigma-B factor antagonist RsbV [Bacillus sonorensis L12]MBG9913531.1 anti-sigma-B factor antagonist [Bacillus sonorensis]MCF7619746.1 anti-sigma factor antagonist [Bacillus sonorensis]
MNLAVDTKKNDHVIEVNVAGEIDVHSAPALREQLMPLAEEGRDLRVCLEDVSYMDSTGLGVFVAIYKAVNKTGGSLVLENLSDRLIRLFDITGLKDIIDISGKSEGGL